MFRLLAVASLALCASSPAWAKSGIENLVVHVRGSNAQWTATPLRLAPGDVLICWASGAVKVAGNRPPTGPAGHVDGSGALQVRIGDTVVRTVGPKNVVQGQV